MPVRPKSVYEEASPDDGVRVLTTNYWPRGVSKERGGTYLRILAPEREPLRRFKAGEMDWPDYGAAYIERMAGDDQRAAIDELAQRARTETVTVMCVCKDAAECHRGLLVELIEEAMRIPA